MTLDLFLYTGFFGGVTTSSKRKIKIENKKSSSDHSKVKSIQNKGFPSFIRFGKDKPFSENSNLSNFADINFFMKKVKPLCAFQTVYILLKKKKFFLFHITLLKIFIYSRVETS